MSHDAAFLNRAVTAVCAVEGRRLTKYPGNYAAYQAKKECLEGEHLRQYTAQQREIARTETYIRKNRAGRNAKMARGRQKRLDRLERLAAPEGRRPGGGGTVGRVPQSGAGGAGPLRACRTEGGADRV